MNVTFRAAGTKFIPHFSDKKTDFKPTFGGCFKVVSADYFTGPTECTPTEEEQTIPCLNKTMPAAVVIHKIPSNYGRITYNGSRIRVE